jgi:hypothetical protein
MSRQNLQAIDRFGPEARAQSLDELGGLGAGTTTVLARLPHGIGRKHA